MRPAFSTPLSLRRRSNWEALDAGILLWRGNFIYFLIFFAIPLWLFAFGLRIIPERLRFVSWLILWFARPLFERLVLHIISVRFFEKGADFRRLCRGLFKTLARGLAADLSWRRFSPIRAGMMPVRTLEGLSFRKIPERRRLLKKGGLGFCRVLTIWALIMEIILLGGELLFSLMMLEILQPGLSSTLKEIVGGWEIYIYAAWCINSILVGSLYVCMGFSLYLNCRVELEGWDLEVIFRGLAEKSKNKNPARTITIICIAIALFMPPGNAAAKENPQKKEDVRSYSWYSFSGDEPLEALHEILNSPDFGGEKDGWGIRLKHRQEKKTPDINPNLNVLLEKIKQLVASSLRIILIGIIAFIAIIIFKYLYKHRGGRAIFNKTRGIRPIPNPKGINPDKLLARSQELFNRGQFRQAWGLCIAAIFRALTVHRGIVFPPGATEYDCLDIARNAGQEDSPDAAVNNWVSFAYGGQQLLPGDYWQAVDYCAALFSREPQEIPPERINSVPQETSND